MSRKPLISIITPAFNCSELIKQTYASLESQNITNWEWVITEDCSSDNSYSIIKALQAKDNRIRLFRNCVNSGAAVSRNNSISKSEGSFLAFLDSDDIWLANKLDKQMEFMQQKSIDFSFTAYELIDEKGVRLGKSVDTHLVEPLTYEDMLCKKATLGCSTVMIRRAAFQDISMPLIRTGQDYALWLKLLKTGVKAYPLPEILTSYRILPNSISRNKFKKAKRQWQIYRDIEALNLIKSINCFCFYSWRAIFRK